MNEMHDEFLSGAPMIRQPEKNAVMECLDSGWLSTGPRVARFERMFGNYKQSRNVVAVSSGTAALHLSTMAAGLGAGDEVITTPLTACSTINAIIHTGATPVLADVDPHTMNIDPQQVVRCITERTKALIIVHFGGRACDMTPLLSIAREHNLVVIEDCSHAIETTHRGRAVGTLGDFGCFSFDTTRNICAGEGGMVITRNPEHAARIKTLALHGLTPDAWNRHADHGYKHYLATDVGFKYNMMDIQAAIGIHQLTRVEQNWTRRRGVWSSYQRELADLPVQLPAAPEPGARHAHHLFPVRIDEQTFGMTRDGFLAEMADHNIGVAVHYISVAEHPCYQSLFGWKPEDYPNAMQIGHETVSLPISPRLLDHDVHRVVDAVREIAGVSADVVTPEDTDVADDRDAIRAAA